MKQSDYYVLELEGKKKKKKKNGRGSCSRTKTQEIEKFPQLSCRPKNFAGNKTQNKAHIKN